MRPDLERRVRQLADAVKHRGPDSDGVWVAPENPVALGHRRLSIIDLSPAGQQPMCSHAGEHQLVFNGEVYNFAVLRQELDCGRQREWRGHSDSEVMLEAVATWGLDAALEKMNGMFAFACYDRRAATLSLVRDRLGVKPLYVGRGRDGTLLFGSEARALARDEHFEARLNRVALPSYFAYGYFPHHHCVYESAVSLAPGSTVTFAADATRIDWNGFLSAAQGNPDGPFDLRGAGWHYRTFWSSTESWSRGLAAPFRGTFDEAVEAGESLLRDAIAIRMVADVPLGALLSGGIDSSLVVALMQQRSGRPIRTFSIGFDVAEFDESRHAEAIARHLGTEHTTLSVSRKEALEVASRVGALLDEPLADASFVPTYLVSALTRQHVTVAMTGDGGDEFFGGYWRYRALDRLGPVYHTPEFLRSVIRAVASRLTVRRPTSGKWRRGWFRFARLLQLASRSDFSRAYDDATSLPCSGRLVFQRGEDLRKHRRVPGLNLHLGEEMMRFDVLNVLPDDLLVKMDRASMAVGLECREPLLDFRLHDFAATLPLSYKLELKGGKRLLRNMVARHLPREIMERPKQGFTPPLAQWMRSELKTCVAEALFDGSADDIVVRDAVERLWTEHQTAKWDHSESLWRVFVLKQWLAAHRWS
ncbi:MAG: asparagine synthase (glutamine-hydrolyzing) [Opitutae bacterium]|nr:asparagine synthase (glutamine-hydrolyzing) [Opitutae bacterium]